MKKILLCSILLSAISFSQTPQAADSGKTTGTGTETPCPGMPTVTYAGKTYNTVLIGSQCWLRENLDVGTMISRRQDQTNDSVIEKYCYNDDTSNCNKYGGLYQWDEAMQYTTAEGARGICPSGWHIPKYAEYVTLRTAVEENGNALKAIGQGTGTEAGTNASGFSALLAGSHGHIGNFTSLGFTTRLWSSTANSASGAFSLYLNYNAGTILLYNSIKPDAFSVRCLKD